MPIGTYTPPLQIATQFFFKFIYLFFHFRCILLQISHKNIFYYMLFLSSGVPGLMLTVAQPKLRTDWIATL